MNVLKKIMLRSNIVLILYCCILGVGMSQELQDAIATGKQEYKRSCALCHGDSGTGDGVYASKLLIKPADLTLLKIENDGTFPIKNVFQIIEGSEDVELHGPRTMPVWGDRFDHESVLYVDERFTKTFVRGRIFELILYLKEIQKKI